MTSMNGGHHAHQSKREHDQEIEELATKIDPTGYWAYQLFIQGKLMAYTRLVLFWVFIYIFLFSGEPDIMDSIRRLITGGQ